ncbi:serpin family protein [Streptomyces sp. NPDC047072]|uniref:serpin family protein n=1 Tax=Streptomyces sp. NPDC047072 TaxID=3154809 RepID=UPI003405B584
MPVTLATIRAVNGLTTRWSDTVTGNGTAFSALGVWPLLALLADGAGGPARTELAEAVGLPPERSAGAARELLGALRTVRGLDSALGVWTRRTLELREEWAAGLPAHAHGVLTGDPATDRRALDGWAAERTGGLIERMPVSVRDDPELVLASALVLRTDWLRPFRDFLMLPETGPWQDRELLGLYRTSTLLDRIGVADTPHGRVTELKVLGDTAVDVHLLLGEEHMTPGQVLGAGVGILDRRRPVLSGLHFPYGEPGPGVSVVKLRTARPQPPTLAVSTAAFEVRAQHDLLELDRLFGLGSARDTTRGHFPGVSDFPPAVGSARQSVLARFTATGFRAAAVTAVAAAPGGVPALRWTTTRIRAAFDRPFGFLAVHRHSRLVVASGWVTDPEVYPREAAMPTEEL